MKVRLPPTDEENGAYVIEIETQEGWLRSYR